MGQNPNNQQPLPNRVSLVKLFQFASTSEKWQICIGSILSFMNGFIQPLFGIFFGDVVNGYRTGSSLDEIVNAIGLVAIKFVIVGFISFVISLCMLYCWINVGESQAINIRIAYFKSLLVQEPGYFDSLNCTELSSKVAQDCQKVQKAIGEKLCMYIFIMSMLVGSIVLSFIKGWIIALVCLAILPFIVATSLFLTWVQNGVRSKTSDVYLEAGGRVEQALNSIRTVKSLAGEEHELTKYTSLLHKAYKVAFNYSMFTGIGLGLRNFVIFLNFSVTLWIGATLIDSEVFNDSTQSDYAYSEILSVFLAFLITCFQIGQATESMKAFNEARVAGQSLFEVIDRIPKISSCEAKGKQDQSTTKFDFSEAEIKFDEVTFAYPTKSNQIITKDLSFTVRANKCTAIIGASGSGKSTIVALIERFYDPISGSIQINGVDIKGIPLNNLRQSIGYVSQEPVLFATTIRENLLYALPTATEEQMIEALIQANIWDFVSALPAKLDSFVGQNALQLSGGQKQRICIARSILKKPSIFLFDEATSALDMTSERIVQSTIDRLAKTCTTIIVAHRLSTIRNADDIIVMDAGKIVEQGSYSDLLQMNGFFTRFVQAQEEKKESNELNTKINLETQDQQQFQDQNAFRGCYKDEMGVEPKNPTILTTEINFQTEFPDEQQNLHHNQQSQQLDTQKGLISKDHFLNTATDLNSKETITSRAALKAMKEEKVERSFWTIVKIWYAYNPSQTIKAILGIFLAFISGFSYPLVGLVLGHISETLILEKEGYKEESDRYSMYFAIIAAANFFTMSLQYYFQSQISESLTFALRRDLFKKFLHMPVYWFDQSKNNSANLSLALASDSSAVNILVSTVITFSVQNISTLTSGVVLALVSEWKTALVGIGVMPILIAIGTFYANKMSIFVRGMAKSSEETAVLVNETAYYIRTVASLANNDKFIESFSRNLNGNRTMIKKTARDAGFAIGLDQFALFCSYGGIFYCGVLFMRLDGGGSPSNTMSAITCLLFASLSIGKNMEYMGNASLAMSCSQRILDFLEADDEKVNAIEKEIKEVKGEIVFENVTFKYPERNVPVLKNVSFNIPANSKVAFVGASGSGKSSILQLIQRFYSDYTGRILIDGIDLKELNLNQLRSKVLGVVQQEPVLFFGSIKDNIVYNTQSVTQSDILNAVEQVHIMELINQPSKTTQEVPGSMFEGFERQIGARGVQISGGQKQRIAIARMILKKPKIILLDEATSALDSQNEKKVQQSLDKILENRTSITVAHRISTIQQSDRIYVLSDGEIVEEGSYHTLMDNRSHFFNMQQKVEQGTS